VPPDRRGSATGANFRRISDRRPLMIRGGAQARPADFESVDQGSGL
jgi:hypothetical protein